MHHIILIETGATYSCKQVIFITCNGSFIKCAVFSVFRGESQMKMQCVHLLFPPINRDRPKHITDSRIQVF